MARSNSLKAFTLLALALAIGLALLLEAEPAKAAFPGENGKIAYVHEGSYYDILTMNADGTGKTLLTKDTVTDWEPAWSPNGKKIVFASGQDSIFDIYTMNADGTQKRRLTRTPTITESTPTWSPNGKKIAFVSLVNNNYEIYVMNTDGTGRTRLTVHPRADLNPSWSPDGKKIAFESRRDNGQGEIYTMDAKPESAANRPKRLTFSRSRDGAPSWSPDGKKIAFESGRAGPFTDDDTQLDVFTMNADGTEQTLLTTGNGTSRQPAFSPDGEKIAFVGFREGTGSREIYVMDAVPESAVNQPRRLTNNQVNDVTPDWQPVP